VAGELGSVPHCVLSAAHRPNLTIAVSEEAAPGERAVKKGAPGKLSKSNESRHRSGWFVRARSGRSGSRFYVGKLGFPRSIRTCATVTIAGFTVQHPEQPSFQLGLFVPGPPAIDEAPPRSPLRAIVAQRRDATAGAGRERLSRRLRSDARQRCRVHTGNPSTASATVGRPASATRRETAGKMISRRAADREDTMRAKRTGFVSSTAGYRSPSRWLSSST